MMQDEPTVEQFAEWWMKNKPFNPPFNNVSKVGKNMTSVLYREGQFQVQIVLCEPNSEITPHIHPDVDAIEYYMGGDVFFHKNGKELLPREDFYETDDGFHAVFLNKEKPCITHVLPSDWHGAEIGGAVFL